MAQLTWNKVPGSMNFSTISSLRLKVACRDFFSARYSL